MSKVVKFGGSSLADANQFRKVYEIIKSDDERRYVVPSAPGKRFKDDIKVTDLLYKAYNAQSEKEMTLTFNEIKERYQNIIDDLHLDISLEEDFKVIEKAFQEQIGEDYAASRGEYLNGKVLACYLGFEFIDAKDVIFIDSHGNYDAKKTETTVSACISFLCFHLLSKLHIESSSVCNFSLNLIG